MDRERLDQWCERGIVGLVLAILVWGPLATGAVLPWEFLVIQGLTLGILVLWLVRLWLGSNPRLLWPPICWAVLAFVGYAIVRYRLADIEYIARQDLIRILVYAFLFFAILNHAYRQESIQIVVTVLVGLGALEALYAVYQSATGSPFVLTFPKPEIYRGRASGSYICPDHLAGLLEMILPMAIALGLMGRFSHVVRILFGYAAALILAGISVTVSRAGWVVTGVVLLALFCWSWRYRNYRLPALILLVLALGSGLLFFRHTYTSRFRFRDLAIAGTEDMRFKIWHSAVQVWRENIWLGVGPDHFDYHYPKYRTKDVQLRPVRVHNDYLDLLAEWGVVGAAVVASSFFLLYWGAFRSWKHLKHSTNDLSVRKSNKSAVVLGASTALGALLLHSIVDFNLHIPANATLAVTLMAVITSHTRFATDRYWVSRSWFVRLLASLALLAGLAYLGPQGWRHWQEDRELRQAKKVIFPSFQVPLLVKAHAVEPMNPTTTYQLGEAYRSLSWLGDKDYRAYADKAIGWFELTEKLNRWDVSCWVRHGMCLDWLDRYDEGGSCMDQAKQLDPNSHFVVAMEGWHWAQVGADAHRRGDRKLAQTCYGRALALLDKAMFMGSMQLAPPFINIVKRRLAELTEGK